MYEFNRVLCIILLSLMTVTAFAVDKLKPYFDLAFSAASSSKRFTQASRLDASFLLDTQGIEDGLPQSTIRSMAQDDFGFIYFATDDGLSRYDGVSHHLISLDSLSDRRLSRFSQVCSEPKGVWASSFDGGVLFFDYHTRITREFYIKELIEPSRFHSVLGCAKGFDDKMWFVLANGLLQISAGETAKVEHRVWLEPELNNGLQLRQIQSHGQQLFVASNQGIKIVYDKGLLDLPVEGAFNRNIKQIMFDDQQRLWTIADNQIYMLTQKNKRWRLQSNKLLSRLNDLSKKTRLTTLAQFHHSQIWVATESEGVWIIDQQRNQLYRLGRNTRPAITNNRIASLLQTTDGSIWIGTWLNGVNQLRFSSPGIRIIDHFENHLGERFEPSVRAITQTSDGRYWIGTDEDGLFSGDSLTQPMTHFQQINASDRGLPSNTIRVIFERHNGELWVGTEGGVARYNPTESSDHAFAPIPSASSVTGTRIRSLMEDSDRQLWVGSYDKGLSFWNAVTQRFVHVPLIEQGESPKVTQLFLDQEQRLWVATANIGVFVLDPVQKKILRHIEEHSSDRLGIPNNFIRSIFQQDNNTFWMGSNDSGLSRYQWSDQSDQLIGPMETGQGLSSNVIYSILQDDEGWLWSSTNKGLARYNLQGKSYSQYTRLHGLAHNKFNSGAHFKDQSGRLLFGGLAGLVLVDPERIVSSGQHNRVVLNQMTFNERAALDDDAVHFHGLFFAPEKIVVTRRYHKIKMTFSSSDYFSDGEQTFAYRLVGIDSHWNFSLGDHLEAIYHGLPSGRYWMEVKQRSANGVWSEPPLTFELLLLPPWWASGWAYFFYVAILGVACWRLWGYWKHSQQRNQRSVVRLNHLVERRTQWLKTRNDELRVANKALKKANRQLEEVSMTDSLTGMGNRRMLLHYLERDLGDIKRVYAGLKSDYSNLQQIQQRDMLFFMIDIDHFKAVNDHHGHAAGDRVLLQISKVIAHVIREGDYVIRYGGEEFLLVLRNSPRSQAGLVAERLLNAFSEYAFQIDDLHTIQLTCSVGFVAYPFSNLSFNQFSPSQVIELADHCLYCAKESGRNCWVGMYGTYANNRVSLEQIHDNPLDLYKRGHIELLTSLDLQHLKWVTSIDYL